MGRIKNIIGNRYGKLIVIEKTEERKNNKVVWKCRCDCGNITYSVKSQLDSGYKKSCGCLREDNKFKVFNVPVNKKPILINNINIYNTRLYKIYRGIKDRCYNSNNKSYKYYGSKGIKLCDNWKDYFEEFYKWSLNNGYSDELTIDRIDNNGSYEPNNCRWVSQKVQCNNKSNNAYVKYKGQKYTYSEFEYKFKIPQKNISKLIKRGYKIEEIVLLYSCLKTKEVSELLNITKYKLMGLIKNKILTPDFIDKGGHYYFLEEQIIKYKNKGGEVC